jgi:hypothetical protein
MFATLSIIFVFSLLAFQTLLEPNMSFAVKMDPDVCNPMSVTVQSVPINYVTMFDPLSPVLHLHEMSKFSHRRN